MKTIDIKGFIKTPKLSASGGIYKGRVTLPEVQWTGSGSETVATLTLTADEIVDAAEGNLLWTDQGVQRGIHPHAPRATTEQISLLAGYPDERIYIFHGENADDMAEKILSNQKIFFNPLVWNLRPGTFEAYYDSERREIYLYSGKIFLPDSHHRHQALIKAIRAYRDSPGSYPNFDPSRQFKIELYFLDRQGEGDYFFDKNQRPRSTAMSKAYDLTSQDDLSVLAKRVLELNQDLDRGVNRVTDRLNKKSPHFLTLSTLRGVMQTFAGSNEVEEVELEGLAHVAAEFFTLLAQVRPELRSSTAHSERTGSLASSAVVMYGYAVLMREYNLDIARLGRRDALRRWNDLLSKLSPQSAAGQDGDWAGDFMSDDNPVWEAAGIVRVSPQGRRTVSNTGGTRLRAGEVLMKRLGLDGGAK